MKSFWSLLVLLLTLSSSCGAADVELRVLNWNIHHAEGIDRKLDLKRIAQVINSVKPDIVALQEVDQKVSRTGKVDQPAKLAELTGLQVVFGGNIEFGGGGYGNAVLSRHPIISSQNHRLPNRDNGEQRGVLQTSIRVPGVPAPVSFFATHLDHRRADEERFASAQAINRLAMQEPARLAVLAGDLNDVEGNRTLTELLKTWQAANETPIFTIPVEKPTRQIDFILFRPSERWKVAEVRVLDEAVASDHRAVFAVLKLIEPKTN